MSEGNGKLPKGWAKGVIGDLVDHITGGVSTKKDDYVSDGVLVLNKGNIKQHGIISFDGPRKYVSRDYFKENQSRDLNDGDVVVTLRDLSVKADFLGLIGTYTESEPALLTQGAYRLAINKDIDPDFLVRFSNAPSYRSWVKAHKNGSTQVHLRNGQFLEIPIKISPLPEQRRIVAKIEALQERSGRAREALAEVGPLLEQFRQSLLAAAFRGDLTADWRADNPNIEPVSELLNRIRKERRQKWEEVELAKYEAKSKQPPRDWKDKYKESKPVDDTDLPDLPKGWCWVSMVELPKDELYSLTIGPFGSNLKVADYTTSGVPLVFVREIRAETFGDNNTKYISVEKFEELSSHKVKGGDLLITKMGDPPGDTSIYPRSFPDAVITADCIKLAPNPQLTSSELLRYWLRAEPMREKILEETKGVAQRKLSLKRFRAITLPLPPHQEQQEIIRLIEEAIEPSDVVEQNIASAEAELTQLDQSILAKAFRGELVPQDPNDEPASQLLERIRRQRQAAQQNGKPKKRAKRKTKHKVS